MFKWYLIVFKLLHLELVVLLKFLVLAIWTSMKVSWHLLLCIWNFNVSLFILLVSFILVLELIVRLLIHVANLGAWSCAAFLSFILRINVPSFLVVVLLVDYLFVNLTLSVVVEHFLVLLLFVGSLVVSQHILIVKFLITVCIYLLNLVFLNFTNFGILE